MEGKYLHIFCLLLNMYSLSILEIGAGSRALQGSSDGLLNKIPVVGIQLRKRDPEIFGDILKSVEATATIDQTNRHTNSSKASGTANTMKVGCRVRATILVLRDVLASISTPSFMSSSFLASDLRN